jgi:FKBP-type peptidyl-prolyl cis-trans isomerase
MQKISQNATKNNKTSLKNSSKTTRLQHPIKPRRNLPTRPISPNLKHHNTAFHTKPTHLPASTSNRPHSISTTTTRHFLSNPEKRYKKILTELEKDDSFKKTSQGYYYVYLTQNKDQSLRPRIADNEIVSYQYSIQTLQGIPLKNSTEGYLPTVEPLSSVDPPSVRHFLQQYVSPGESIQALIPPHEYQGAVDFPHSTLPLWSFYHLTLTVFEPPRAAYNRRINEGIQFYNKVKATGNWHEAQEGFLYQFIQNDENDQDFEDNSIKRYLDVKNKRESNYSIGGPHPTLNNTCIVRYEGSLINNLLFHSTFRSGVTENINLSAVDDTYIDNDVIGPGKTDQKGMDLKLATDIAQNNILLNSIERHHYRETRLNSKHAHLLVNSDGQTVFPIGLKQLLTKYMSPGDKCRVVLPADSAFGNEQIGKMIKPGSTLCYTIELEGFY